MTSRTFRSKPQAGDPQAVRRLVTDAEVFSGIEIGWAAELVEETLKRGRAAGYHFLFADGIDDLEGYTCFGPIDGTQNRFDLYWIVVSPKAQGKGLGKRLLAETMHAARALDAQHMFIDTSTRPDYAPARALYEALGFAHMGTLVDFYSDGDGKALFGRKL
ncbi:MAG: GNAT family N-acetyltransferase [Alphaproteobacteria bacterium]|nr:GNAT family N-acetyltransferase [Alphaproteobacteria bacterium]